jgi:hypothetical protein
MDGCCPQRPRAAGLFHPCGRPRRLPSRAASGVQCHFARSPEGLPVRFLASTRPVATGLWPQLHRRRSGLSVHRPVVASMG